MPEADPPADASPESPYTVAWVTKLPPSRGGAADAERIYVTLQGRGIAALARDSGEPIWSRQLESAWAAQVNGDALFVTATGGLYELDPATGSTRWQVELPARPAGPMAAAAGGLHVVSLTSGALYAVRGDATVAWQLALDASSGSPPLATDPCHTVYVSLDDGQLAAVACDGSGVRWSQAVGGTLTDPVLAGDRVLVGSTTDRLYAFETGSGRLDWHLDTGNDVVGAVTDDRRIFLVSLDNVVRALDRDSGNLHWQQVTTTRPVAPPFRVGGRLFVPGVRPALMIYDTRTGEPQDPVTLPEPYARLLLAGPPLVLPADDASSVGIAVIAREGTVIGLR